MAQSNIYAGVAGYVGRADQVGKVGVFTRASGAESWTPAAACRTTTRW